MNRIIQSHKLNPRRPGTKIEFGTSASCARFSTSKRKMEDSGVAITAVNCFPPKKKKKQKENKRFSVLQFPSLYSPNTPARFMLSSRIPGKSLRQDRNFRFLQFLHIL